MKVIFLIVALASAALAAKLEVKNDRIVGGVETTIEKYPGAVQLESRTLIFWSLTCGANILTSRWVLSAAHCFIILAEGNRRIRAGATETGVGGTIIRIERFIMHPEYSALFGGNNNDIALAHLESPLSFGDTIAVSTILAQGTELPDNALATHVGWGTLVSGGPIATVLNEVDVFIVNRNVCQERYDAYPLQWLYNFRITENMVCAGVLDIGGQDACQGDSGGPLYVQGFLVGLVSWGLGCADPLYPGVNTNVAAFTNWIIQNAV